MHQNPLKIDLRTLPPSEAARILSAVREAIQKLEKQGHLVRTREKDPPQLLLCFDDLAQDR